MTKNGYDALHFKLLPNDLFTNYKSAGNCGFGHIYWRNP